MKKPGWNPPSRILNELRDVATCNEQGEWNIWNPPSRILNELRDAATCNEQGEWKEYSVEAIEDSTLAGEILKI